MTRSIEGIREQARRYYGDLGIDLLAKREKREPGTSTKNPQAMNHLYQIVGTSNLKQDIKRIKSTQSLDGAKAWAKKHGFHEDDAIEEDIDKDGIADVVVKDKNGNYVVVNGYTIRPSDFPYRKKFYEEPPSVRKDYRGYKQYIKDAYYGPVYDEETGGIDGWRYRNPKEDDFTKSLEKGKFKTLVPKKQSPYQMFASGYIKHMYDFVIDHYNLYTSDGKRPNIFVKLATKCWNDWVIQPSLLAVLGDEEKVQEFASDPKRLNRLKSKAGFKKLVTTFVYNYFTHSDETNQDLLNDIHDKTYELVEEWFDRTGADKCDDYGEENPDVVFEPVVPVSPQRAVRPPEDEADI